MKKKEKNNLQIVSIIVMIILWWLSNNKKSEDANSDSNLDSDGNFISGVNPETDVPVFGTSTEPVDNTIETMDEYIENTSTNQSNCN